LEKETRPKKIKEGVEEKGNEELTDEDSKESVWRGKSTERF
jgi:hypothetical protein